MENRRICYSCGKEYEFCPRCPSDSRKEPWHMMFDSCQCKDVFYTVSSVNAGSLTPKQARRALSAYDMSDRSLYTDKICRVLDAIYSTGKQQNKH